MPVAVILVIAAAVSGLAHVRSQPSGIRLFHVFNCRTADPRHARILERLHAPLRQLVEDRLALCARYEPRLPPGTDPDDKVMLMDVRRELERAIVVYLADQTWAPKPPATRARRD